MSYKDLQNAKVELPVPPELQKHKIFLESLFNREYLREKKVRLYGSEAGFCSRKNVFSSVLDTKHEENIIQTFRQAYGYAAEDVWVKALSNAGDLIVADFKITDILKNITDIENGMFLESSPQLNYSAKIDFIYKFNGELILADSKCTSAIPKKVSLQYQRQLQFYSAVTGISQAFILHTTHQKGMFQNFEWELFEIPTDDRTLQEIVENAYVAKICIERELLPPIKKEMFKTTTCKFCSFSKYCYSEDEIEVYPLTIPEVEIEMEVFQEATRSAIKFLSGREERRQKILEFIAAK